MEDRPVVDIEDILPLLDECMLVDPPERRIVLQLIQVPNSLVAPQILLIRQRVDDDRSAHPRSLIPRRLVGLLLIRLLLRLRRTPQLCRPRLPKLLRKRRCKIQILLASYKRHARILSAVGERLRGSGNDVLRHGRRTDELDQVANVPRDEPVARKPSPASLRRLIYCVLQLQTVHEHPTRLVSRRTLLQHQR